MSEGVRRSLECHSRFISIFTRFLFYNSTMGCHVIDSVKKIVCGMSECRARQMFLFLLQVHKRKHIIICALCAHTTHYTPR